MERRAAGFVIYKVVNEIQYLLLKPSNGDLHWSAPKGHVDPGETDFETAVRETEEETGYIPKDLKIIENFKKELHYNVQGCPKTVIYWLAELKNVEKPVKLSCEHEAFQWNQLSKSSELAKYKDMQEVLEECEKYIAGMK